MEIEHKKSSDDIERTGVLVPFPHEIIFSPVHSEHDRMAFLATITF